MSKRAIFVFTAAALASPAAAQTPDFEQTWGGETRQVFSLELASGARHVWTAGDGPLIRHAIDPGSGVTWTHQATPADVTQNLLDVHFVPGPGAPGPDHLGFAVGLGGHVLTSDDYGQNWTHLDTGEVQNQLAPTEDATLWRGRFTSEDNGFVCGLWAFKRWNGTAWSEVDLLDRFDNSVDGDMFEFYALELLVDPNNPNRWVGVLAGQIWGGAGGGGHPDSGVVFYGSWAVDGGNTWKEVFRTEVAGPPYVSYQDPWDIEFEPNPTSLGNSVGYLCAGTGTGNGAVFRTDDGGKTWDPTPELVGTSTLYGIGVLSADEVVAAGYAGQVWTRDASGWTCRRGVGCSPPPAENQTAPLAGVHGEDGDTYVVGSFGYVRMSTDLYASATIDLHPSASEQQSEHWRLADLDFTSDTRGYAVSAHKTIIDSFDGGEEWDLSATSPNSLSTAGNVPPLRSVDFREGGGSGVAVGYGEVSTLAPFTTPTLAEAFAYYQHETTNPTWTASQLTFSPTDDWLLLEDVAWADGDDASAEFWAVGRSGDNNPYNPTNPSPVLLRSTDGGATWEDGEAAAGVSIPGSVRLNAIAFRSATQGFAVGWSTATTRSVVYRIDLTGMTPTVTSVPVSGGGSLEILDVAGNASFVAACGKDESIFVYNQLTTPAEFTRITTGVPDMGFDQPTAFLSIAAPPGADPRVLIGANNSGQEADAPGLGKMLYYDAGWSLIPAATNKSVVSIELRDDRGFGIAGKGLTGAGPEFGMVADAAVLRFVFP